MQNASNVKEIGLDGTKKGKIFVATLEEPYGEGSETVASIGVSLAGKLEEIDWKVHIPRSNVNDVIGALQELQ